MAWYNDLGQKAWDYNKMWMTGGGTNPLGDYMPDSVPGTGSGGSETAAMFSSQQADDRARAIASGAAFAGQATQQRTGTSYDFAGRGAKINPYAPPPFPGAIKVPDSSGNEVWAPPGTPPGSIPGDPNKVARGWQAQQISAEGPRTPEQARAEQMTAIGMFRGAAEGTAPSVAAMQQSMAQNQIVRDQAAIAAQARGADASGARRAQMMAMGDQGQNAAMQAAMLRAQEMAQARGQYGQAADSLRAGDQALEQQRAQQMLTAAQSNQAADIEGKKVYEDTQKSLRAAELQADALRVQGTGQIASIAAADKDAAAKQEAAKMGGLATLGAAGATAMSDEQQKTDVADGRGAADAFLRALSGSQNSYRYKDPDADGAGQRLGPMAQDLEKTPVGDSVVRDTPRGKMVDVNAFVTALASAVGRLNEKVEERR